MSTVSLISPAPAAVEDDDTSGSHWAPHGPLLTACVVGINLLMILLIFFFFWRYYFSRKRGPSSSSAGAAAGEDDDDDDDASSTASLPVASPWAWARAASSRRRRSSSSRDHGLDDVASTLPVYVYASASGEGEKAAECAVCIVELRDGDSARLLPRCGHRFHADCVGAWLRIHATCPLCRAAVVAPPPGDAAAADESGREEEAKDDDSPV